MTETVNKIADISIDELWRSAPIREQIFDPAALTHLPARQLIQYANRPDVLVLGLPRGGVPVAFVQFSRLGLVLTRISQIVLRMEMWFKGEFL